MSKSRQPATIVVCAAAPRQRPAGGDTAWLRRAKSSAVPVTWIAGVDRLADIAALEEEAGGAASLAVDIPPAVCGSRQKLRDLLARAADAVPDLAAAVLRGPTPLANRTLLVERGIGVALVDSFDGGERGSRRPSPRGWPCRNSIWGLWEVLATPHRPRGIAGWLGFTTMPRLKSGGLHVVPGEASSSGSGDADATLAKLDRWVAWAGRRARHGAVVATLAQVPDLVGRDARTPLAGSVLRAA